MIRKFVLLFMFLVITYCTNLNDNPVQAPSTPSPDTQLLFTMDTIPANVQSVKGFLARAEFDTIFFDFVLNGNQAHAKVENIQPGTWYLQVDAFGGEGTLLYSGNTFVRVEPGKITPVYLSLNPVTGGLIIFVTWSDIVHPLLAYFPFDGDMKDLSPYHNNGQRFGRTTFSAGVRGQALEFDGETGYAQIPHINAYNCDVYTVAFWFYKADSSIEDTPGWDDVEGLVFKAYDTSKYRDFSFLIGWQTPPFRFNFSIYNGGDSLLFLRVRDAIVPRTWYHIAGVVGHRKMYLYINGELIKEKTFEGKLYHSDAPIILGAVPPVDRMIHRFFRGKIDELILFDGALPQHDIQKIMLKGIFF